MYLCKRYRLAANLRGWYNVLYVSWQVGEVAPELQEIRDDLGRRDEVACGRSGVFKEMIAA